MSLFDHFYLSDWTSDRAVGNLTNILKKFQHKVMSHILCQSYNKYDIILHINVENVFLRFLFLYVFTFFLFSQKTLHKKRIKILINFNENTSKR